MSSQKRILVIDDEPEVGEVILDFLRPYYPNTSYISDSRLALTCLEKETFALIISDVSMPGLPGPELIRTLRANGDWTLVVFLTGHASKETILTALRLGVSDVLEKPFEEENLIKTVQRIFEIDKRRSRLIVDNAKETSEEELEKQSKMLGLLHLANEQKKTG